MRSEFLQPSYFAIAILSGVLLAVSGCGKSVKQREEEQKAAREKLVTLLKLEGRKAMEGGIRNQMKDPESTNFRNFAHFASYAELPPTPESIPLTQVICGEVNAKNSYGAYAGFKDFVATVNIDPSVAKPYAGTFDVMLDPGGDEYRRRDFVFVQKRDCQDKKAAG